MHHLGNPGDSVNWTGAGAEVAADAKRLVDSSDLIEIRLPELRIEGGGVAAEKLGESLNGSVSTGRTAIDGSCAVSDGLRVGAAPGIAALSTLDTRQNPLDPVRDRIRRW